MNQEKVILLLGRRDEPTDGVADYCEKLRGAGLPRGLSFEIATVHWAEKGWRNALAELREAASAWRDRWVLLQFTTLAWSRRGFPLRAPRVLDVLRQCGARPGVVFHDFSPLSGAGIVGSVREYSHLLTLRQLYAGSELAIFTVPLDKVSWLPAHGKKEAFIPVGANYAESVYASRDASPEIKTVAVYSITGGNRTSIEVKDIGTALKRSCNSVGPIRLLLFGRGSREAEPALRSELAGLDIEIQSLGLLSPADVNRTLSGADVLLFVRGQISTRRGSAIAGIASGLPIVCYSGSETCGPITEAGICAVPLGDRDALAAALETVLSDGALRAMLAGRSRQAYEKYFSWAAIAQRFAEELHLRDKTPVSDKGVETETANTAGVAVRRRRIVFLMSHVIQYSSPLFRRMAQDPRLDLQIAYCTLQGATPSIDPEFGVEVKWDTPLLDGYPWAHMPNRSPVPGLGRFFGLCNPGVWGLIRKSHFDAAILPGYFYFTAWIAIAAAKWSGTPIIFITDSHSLRSWNAQSPWKLRFKKWLVRRIFSLGNAIIVSSSGGVEYLKSLGFSSDRIFLVPTAVDNDWWTEQASGVDRAAVRANWKIPQEATVAVFCAKLQQWKGPMDLLEAFAQANVPNSYLVYAGDGPEKGNLERRAVERGVADRVKFLGFVNQSQLPSVYCAADLFVLPSLFEPFGLVVNEAMLCGLPVVVSDRVGAKFDLVRPEENGCVFPAGDVGALARILQQTLSDPQKRARMGAEALRRMETWSPREYVDSFVRAVNRVGKRNN